jgi:hypothetical protein
MARTQVELGESVYQHPDTTGPILGNLLMRFPQTQRTIKNVVGYDPKNLQEQERIKNPRLLKIGYRNSQEWYDLSYDKMRVSKNGFIIDGYDEVYPLENVKFNWGTPFGTVALKMDYKTFHRFLEPKLKPKMVNPWKFKKPTSGGGSFDNLWISSIDKDTHGAAGNHQHTISINNAGGHTH